MSEVSKKFFKVHTLFEKDPTAISGAELKVLMMLAIRMNYSNCLLYDRETQDIIAQKLKIKRRQYLRIINRLRKKNLITINGVWCWITKEFASKGRA